MQVHIHPLVTIYINTLIAWAKCFLSSYGVYPGINDLLDTPRCDFLAAQLHLHDSTLPRPLLPQSRGPLTFRSEYVALQSHLTSPPNSIVSTSVTRPVRPSPCQSVMQPVRPSSRQPPPSVYQPISQSHCLSIPEPVCPSSPSVRRLCSLSTLPSLRPRLVSPPPHPSVLLNVCQAVCHCLTICTPSYHICQAILHCLTIHPPSTPVRQTIRHHHTICTTHQSVRQPVHHHPTV